MSRYEKERKRESNIVKIGFNCSRTLTLNMSVPIIQKLLLVNLVHENTFERFNQRDGKCPQKSIHLALVTASKTTHAESLESKNIFPAQRSKKKKLIMSSPLTMSTVFMHNASESKVLQNVRWNFSKDNK
jgi:hypothetical protein